LTYFKKKHFTFKINRIYAGGSAKDSDLPCFFHKYMRFLRSQLHYNFIAAVNITGKIHSRRKTRRRKNKKKIIVLFDN
ncbi:MAG: hypothetical protein ACM3MI_15065, partial [Clostridiales bacterium]